MTDTLRQDVLIIGGGLAGLRAAVTAHDAGADVAVLSKVYPIRSHSGAAQGGVNAALGNHPEGRDDSWQRHAFDTIKGSDYLADQPRAEILARDAPERVLEMEHWGTYFSRFPDGRIAQRPFGGAGFPRTCYAADRTGHQMLHTLYQQCLKREVRFYNEWLLTRVAVHEGRAEGAVALHVPSGEVRGFRADAVLVAGGGHGRIYAKSTNSYVNVGSATAAVFRAGVPLEDMEFVQFHPTTLYGTNILITEGVRGEGGFLLNAEGDRFMARYAPDAMELAPRDIVARAIQTEIREGRGFADGYVALDVRHLGEPKIKERLPGIRQIAVDFAGVDPVEKPIPVQPAQHYSMGGLACDENGGTGVAGLFVVGECSCISVHGANRLGGNSLLETLVFGRRAGERSAQAASSGRAVGVEARLVQSVEEQEQEIEALKERSSGERQIALRREMQRTMNEHVGIFRDEAGLRTAVDRLAELQDRYETVVLDHRGRGFNYDLVDVLELGGMLELAQVTALGALERSECRGSHWRIDHPGRDDQRWLRHTIVSYGEAGRPAARYKDVIITDYSPQEREY